MPTSRFSSLSLLVHLSFNGNCAEAMNFYQQCLGGSLELQLVADSPLAEQWPPSRQQQVLHAELINKHLMIMASDMGEENVRYFGSLISLALVCSGKKEIEDLFNKLSRGGKVTHPLHHFSDGTIGAFIDRYGINWIVKR